MQEQMAGFTIVPPQPPSREQFLQRLNHQRRMADSWFGDKERKELTDIPEAIPPELKSEVFDPVLPVMRAVGAELGLAVPEDLIARAFVVNRSLLAEIYQYETGDSLPNNDAACCFSNRYLFFSDNDIQNLARKSACSYPEALRYLGVHELWHSFSYKEVWDPVTESERIYQRGRRKRDGFTCVSLHPSINSNQEVGNSLLQEGVDELLTRATLVRGNFTFPSITIYNEPTAIAERLAVAGLESTLVGGIYRDGPLDWFEAEINQILGPNGLNFLTEDMGRDCQGVGTSGYYSRARAFMFQHGLKIPRYVKND